MVNAKDELNKILNRIHKTINDVDYYKIRYGKDWWDNEDITYRKITDLDFRYDNGFGGQELHGLIVFKDGTWLERYEYDGAESWVYKSTPTEAEVKEYC